VRNSQCNTTTDLRTSSFPPLYLPAQTRGAIVRIGCVIPLPTDGRACP